MKSTGIVRKFDNLGRIVVPKELRDKMDIPKGTPMEIYTENDTIILKKYEPACIFCGEAENVVDYKGKKICINCLRELRWNNDK